MGKAELMQEKIEEQRKLPDKIKDKLDNITFVNLIVSISLMIYLIAINILYLNTETHIFMYIVKILAVILGIIDIILFETSYRKDSIPLWIHSFEILCICTLVFSIPYIYVYLNNIFKTMLMFSPIFFSIYYVIKTIIIHVFETKKYQNNLSDVKDIVKDEEEGYLEDISDSSNEEVKIEDENKNAEIGKVKQSQKAKKKEKK